MATELTYSCCDDCTFDCFTPDEHTVPCELGCNQNEEDDYRQRGLIQHND